MKMLDQFIYNEIINVINQQCFRLRRDYEVVPLVWNDVQKRLLHYHLDQFGCLLEKLYSDIKRVPDFYEVLSDFNLIQWVLLKTDLSKAKRVVFLKWYLKHHIDFYLDDKNREIMELVKMSADMRFEANPFGKGKKLDYVSLFNEYQRDCRIVQNFWDFPNEENLSYVKEIYQKWGIHREYIPALCDTCKVVQKTATCKHDSVKKDYVFHNKKRQESKPISKDFLKAQAIELVSRKERMQFLKHCVETSVFLQEFEMLELRQLLNEFYSLEEASLMYKSITIKNTRVRLNEIQMLTFDAEESDLYRNLETKIHEESNGTNDFYCNLIWTSLVEIQDIMKEMIYLSNDSDDFEEYQLMLKEEMKKIKESVPYLYSGSYLNKKLD